MVKLLSSRLIAPNALPELFIPVKLSQASYRARPIPAGLPVSRDNLLADRLAYLQAIA